jgi:hypothetical protein
MTKEYLSPVAETPAVWNLLAYTSAAAAVEARLSEKAAVAPYD